MEMTLTTVNNPETPLKVIEYTDTHKKHTSSSTSSSSFVTAVSFFSY